MKVWWCRIFGKCNLIMFQLVNDYLWQYSLMHVISKFINIICTIQGGSDQGMPVIVSRVAPNTPAYLAIPRLNEGDQVLFINGRDVSQHTHEQVGWSMSHEPTLLLDIWFRVILFHTWTILLIQYFLDSKQVNIFDMSQTLLKFMAFHNNVKLKYGRTAFKKIFC